MYHVLLVKSPELVPLSKSDKVDVDNCFIMSDLRNLRRNQNHNVQPNQYRFRETMKPSQDHLVFFGPTISRQKNRHKNRAPSPGPEAPAGLRLPELHGFRWPGADPGFRFNVLSSC